MTVHSAALAKGSFDFAANDVHTILTVPAGHRWLVRDIAIGNIGSVARDVHWLVQTPSDLLLVGTTTFAAAFRANVVDVWQVLEAGEQLKLFTTVAGVVHWLVSGTDLVLPA